MQSVQSSQQHVESDQFKDYKDFNTNIFPTCGHVFRDISKLNLSEGVIPEGYRDDLDFLH